MTDKQAADVAGKPTPDPDYVSDTGAKWWLHRGHSIRLLKGEQLFIVVPKDETPAFVIADANGEPMYASRYPDAIGAWVDLRRFAFSDAMEGGAK